MTLEEWIKNLNETTGSEWSVYDYVPKLMIEFAKFHVQRALEFTANNAEVILIEGKNEISDDEWGIMDQDGHYIKFVPNKKLILEKYSLNNIT